MNRKFQAEAQDIGDTLFDAMVTLTRGGATPAAVLWAAASALGNLVEELVPKEHLAPTLDNLTKAMTASAKVRGQMRQPPQGSA